MTDFHKLSSATSLVLQARQEKLRGNYKGALTLYLVSAQLNPGLQRGLKEEIAFVLTTLGRDLEGRGKHSKLYEWYEKVINVCPENEIVLNNLGAHLLRLEHLIEARHFIKNALVCNENYLAAYRNLETVNNRLVSLWHFRMLNDSVRNEAYRRAIHKRVSQGLTSVLDIGTGTGILSLNASEAGADKVYACEYSPLMVHLSRQVIQANNATSSITVLPKHSTELRIPQDIPNRVSLIVTETVDAGLLGEKIVETMVHAHENLLSTDGLRCVIPASACLYACLIQSDFLAEKRQLLEFNNGQRSPLKTLLSLSLEGVNIRCEKIGPYDTEILHSLPGGFTQLSDPVQVLTLDFMNVAQMKTLLNEFSKKVTFWCKETGYADAVVVWFSLNLDEEISLSNSPIDGSCSCWDQAVYPFVELTPVHRETAFEVCFTYDSGGLTVNKDSNPKESQNQFLYVPEKAVRYINTFSPFFETLCPQERPLKVLDVSRVPLGGLHLSKSMKAECAWLPRHESIVPLVRRLAEINSCHLEVLSELPETVPHDIFIYDIITTKGEISEEAIWTLKHFRHIAQEKIVYIPSKISVFCQLVSSDELRAWREVDDRATGKLQIGKFINEYKVSHILELNVSKMTVPMSDSCKIASLNVCQLVSDELFETEESFVALRDGEVSAVMYWFEYKIGSRNVSTRARNVYAFPIVELLHPVSVKKDQSIKAHLSYLLGVLRFKLSS